MSLTLCKDYSNSIATREGYAIWLSDKQTANIKRMQTWQELAELEESERLTSILPKFLSENLKKRLAIYFMVKLFPKYCCCIFKCCSPLILFTTSWNHFLTSLFRNSPPMRWVRREWLRSWWNMELPTKPSPRLEWRLFTARLFLVSGSALKLKTVFPFFLKISS